MKNVAIIELSESHAECIYSQMLFLKENVNNIHLILHPKLRVQTEYSFPKLKRFFINEMGGVFQRIRNYLEIKSYLQQNKIDTVIFNTTTGRIVRELLLFLPRKLNYVGSIHDGRKLVKSSTQKAISRKVKKYFTLNDYVTDYLKENKVTNVKLRSYYPIYFPELELENVEKKDSEFWVIIPGKVEQKRRNYFSLVEKLKSNNLPSNVKFILLGPSKHFNGDGNLLEEKIKDAGLRDNFILFDNFVTDTDYYSYLKKADLIMPMIEPGNEFYETYKYSQITGAYNLAFGFTIPLFYHEDLSHIEDLKKFGFDYNSDTLVDKLTKLVENANLRSEIKSRIQAEPKFSLDFQTQNYLEFLK